MELLSGLFLTRSDYFLGKANQVCGIQASQRKTVTDPRPPKASSAVERPEAQALPAAAVPLQKACPEAVAAPQPIPVGLRKQCHAAPAAASPDTSQSPSRKLTTECTVGQILQRVKLLLQPATPQERQVSFS